MQPFFFPKRLSNHLLGYQNKPLSTKQTLAYEIVMYLNEENRMIHLHRSKVNGNKR